MNLALWQRRIPGWVTDGLERWAREKAISFDQILPAGAHDFTRVTAGMSADLRAWVVTDLMTLLGRFAVLTGTPRLRVVFGAVVTDQCAKFHVDYLRFRMVTTYAGPGTEWLPDELVDRAALGHPTDCPCDANDQIVRDRAGIRHATAGEVLVMKGQGRGARGAVHRSPPIEASRAVRVVLIASTVEA